MVASTTVQFSTPAAAAAAPAAVPSVSGEVLCALVPLKLPLKLPPRLPNESERLSVGRTTSQARADAARTNGKGGAGFEPADVVASAGTAAWAVGGVDGLDGFLDAAFPVVTPPCAAATALVEGAVSLSASGR